MIELENHKVDDLLTRTIKVFPAVPPVVDCHYTQSQQMFVDCIRLVFRKRNGGAWTVYDVVATGDRCLKDGVRGRETKKNNYRYTPKDSPRPDWLVEVLAFFTPVD